MIYDLKISVNLKWLLDHRCYIHSLIILFFNILISWLIVCLGKRCLGNVFQSAVDLSPSLYFAHSSDITQGFGYHDHRFEYQDHDYVVEHSAIASANSIIEIVTIINSHHIFLLFWWMLSNLDGVLCVLSLSVWENKIEFNKMSVTRQCWGPLGGTLDQKVQNFVIFYSSSSPSPLPSPIAKIWGWVPDFQNQDHHHLIQHDNDHQQQLHHITSWIPPAPVYHLESE